jgi:hypothetical protein
MQRNYLSGALTTVLSIVTLAFSALAHPADGYTPNEVHPAYGTMKLGERADWSVDDIVFTQPYPDPATLSDIERYMLEGTRDSWVPGAGLDAWWHQVMNVVVSYDRNTGQLPAILTEDVLRAVTWNETTLEARDIEVYSNPITSTPARLQEPAHSPGDLFIKRLSGSEIARLSEKNPALRNDLAGIVLDPTNGSVAQRIRLTSPVYYIRMYGRNGVILSRLYYTFEPL